MTRARQAGLHRLAALLLVGVIAVAAALLALALSSHSPQPPETGAAGVVPADAVAYVNISLDRSRPSVGEALRLAHTFDGFAALAGTFEDRLGRLAGTTGSFADAVRRWVGGEAAVALLPAARNRASALVVLSIRNRRAFARFLADAAAAGSGPGGGPGVAAAGSYAVFGDPAGLAAAARVARHAAPALDADPVFRRASRGEPAARALDAYLPASGLVSLLAGRGGLLGGLGALLDAPGLEGVSASLTPAPGAAHVWIHSVFAAAAPSVRPRAAGAAALHGPAALHGTAGIQGTPSLQGTVPAGAALLLDVPDLAAATPRLLAAGSVAGIGGQVGPLLTRLGAALRSEGVDTHRLVSLFSHEGAVAITSVATHPGLLVLARTPDPGAARELLANLEPPLATLFPPAASGPGAAPVFGTRTIAGVQVHSLDLAPGLQFDYAVSGHLIALATGTDAIASVVRRVRSLGDTAHFRAVLGSSPVPDTSLVFADLTQLIRLGEQTGLLRGAASGVLAGDLTRIAAIGLRSIGGGDESTAELNLSIP